MFKRELRARFWIEAVLAVIGAVLAVLTLVARDWFERLFESSADNGSGEFEWLVSVGFLVAAAVMGVLARREWRRPPVPA